MNIIEQLQLDNSNNNNMSVSLHTNLGDIKIEVFCDTAQRTSFNFLALCASGYYNGTIFHRNIKGFAIQGGDPSGMGKGGESIWGGKFEDEFHTDNTHDKRGQVSMANTGTNSNGSQVSSYRFDISMYICISFWIFIIVDHPYLLIMHVHSNTHVFDPP